jgi:hypothetical protein
VVTVGEIELRIVISPGDGQDRQAASSAKSLLYSLVADPRSLTLVVADQRSGGQPPRQGTPSSRFCQILATMVVTTGINDDTRSSSGHQTTLPDPAVYTATSLPSSKPPRPAFRAIP